MSTDAGRDEDPGYQWAISTDPDIVYVQLPPVDATQGGTARDALRLLFRQRGFTEVTGDPAGDGAADQAGVANGCALVREDDERALLIVTISDRIGATRIPLPHGDPEWSARVFEEGQVLVVLTEDAIDPAALAEGAAERLRRDADAGGLSAAIVPAGAL